MLVKRDQDDEDRRRYSGKTIVLITSSHAIQEEEESSKWGGSVDGRNYIRRHRESANALLHDQYFANLCMYAPDTFRPRFRMYKHVFEKIMCDISIHNDYFIKKCDVTGRPEFSTMQKVACALRQLVYGTVAELFDDTWGIAESTGIEIIKMFTRAIINVYGEEYLRRLTPADLHLLLAKARKRGFPGMMGSLDCMHWRWNACPKGWEGQFAGYKGRATIILEAVASYDTLIWHAFFGLPGSLNVLVKSPLFDDVCMGRNHQVSYEVNGKKYGTGYYLVDGIYPQWASFVKTISRPATPEHQYFAKMQEAYRKDVERAFGILQASWAIVRGPARGCDSVDMYYIMMAFVILHNVIVEDEREENELVSFDPNEVPTRSAKARIHERSLMETDVERDGIRDMGGFMERYQHLKCLVISRSLKKDLVQHLWNMWV